MYGNPYFTYTYHNISVGIVRGSPQKIYPQESLFVAKNTIIIHFLIILYLYTSRLYVWVWYVFLKNKNGKYKHFEMRFYSTFVAFNVILIVTLRITEHDMHIDFVILFQTYIDINIKF